MDSFSWSKASDWAAQLIADGRLTYGAICSKVGVSDTTLRTWRNHPDFQARVNELLAEYREEVRRIGIAVREQRVKAQNARWQKLQKVMKERAKDPAHQGVPGWKTGLLVHDVKSVGAGEMAQVVDIYTIDTGLLKAMLDLEKQTPQDLGQWNETAGSENGKTLAEMIEEMDRAANSYQPERRDPTPPR